MLLSLSLQLPGRLLALKQVPVQLAHGIVRRKQLTRCAFLSPICGHSSRLYHNEDSGAGSGAGGSRILGAPPKAPFYKCFSSSLKKEDFQVKSVEGAEILQNVLQKNKQLLQEKKAVLIQDIRERKEKVKERVEEVIERENVATIPNLLCVGRIALSPYLGYVIVQSDFALAMGLLVVAGLTDLADGLIARNWPSQASRLGSFLDPLADKILLGSLVISMSYVEMMPLWLSGMILFRDAFLIGAGFVIRYISLPQPVSIWQWRIQY
uniref:cardiolipin synthase (CMP-forming) n=1 Tax=Culex pipiens TaxID=7175 RepID=A0A8D8F4E4_CULPI